MTNDGHLDELLDTISQLETRIDVQRDLLERKNQTIDGLTVLAEKWLRHQAFIDKYWRDLEGVAWDQYGVWEKYDDFMKGNDV